MKYKIPVFVIFLCFLCIPVYTQDAAQQEYPEETETNIIDEPDPNTIFFINSFNYIVTGITKPFMLNTKTELKIGEEIKGYNNLIDFIEKKNSY